MDNRETTIEDVRYMCRRGAFRAYAQGEDIYLEDSYTGEKVLLNMQTQTKVRKNPELMPPDSPSSVRVHVKRKQTPPGEPMVQALDTEQKTYSSFYDDDGPYKGFLLIRCGECGEIKAFCAKRGIYSFRCDHCGAQTPLENLRPMFMRCKCGEEFRYKTNLTDKRVTHTCLSCHAPVDMELNRRESAYVTIDERRQGYGEGTL